MKYQIKDLLKLAEVDSYNDGCDPDTTSMSEISVSFTGKTAIEVIGKAADFLGIETSGPDNGTEVNVCGEKGRVDFQGMECEDGSKPSASEIVAWKKGNLKLWAVTYTAMVEKVTPAKL